MNSLPDLLKDIGPIVPENKESFSTNLQNDIIGIAYISKFELVVEYFFSAQWEKCLALSKTMLDITWEHLNTGHWKDVHITWRHAYSYLSLFKALSQYALSFEGNKCTVADAVKTCDMGLLMGAPVMDHVLNKAVGKLQVKWAEKEESLDYNKEHQLTISPQNVPNILESHKVPTIKCPSLEGFKSRYMDPQVPVIIQNSIDYWPALNEPHKWSVGYIRKVAGCRTVPVELGSKYTEETWSQTLMTVNEFISKYIESPVAGETVGYLAQHQLFDQIPELKNDIIIPPYCALGDKEEVDVNAWFGPCGTISPLHQDPKHNLLTQVVGFKYVRLYGVECTPMLYPHSSTLLSNTSQVDVENPDLKSFPDFSKAPYTECMLGPGDMLYMPPKVWHYIRSLSVSFSVSFWWE